MRVLVLGKGGREHALVWKLAQSSRVERVYCTPGNAGTARDGINLPVDPSDFPALIKAARKEKIDFVVVGPEDLLAKGVTDALTAAGFRVFGPTKAAARIEASKVFAKEIMRHADVPTAEFRIFDHPDPAKFYVESRENPLVVKADGLAGGKGVIVCSTKEEAFSAIQRIMVREEFGPGVGRNIVIEKRLEGEELSVFALVGNRTILLLPPTQDHKALLDGDKGPNTGGMGAYCPAPIGTTELLRKLESEVFIPTIHALKRRGFGFNGLLYAGLMLTGQGPRVLEFNARFGDPETQPLLMRLKSDLLELLLAVAEEDLGSYDFTRLEWDPRPTVSVVLASQGYPGTYEVGKVIYGLNEVAEMPDVKVFHAGTKIDADRILTDGGRVLAVTAIGETLAAAKARAYEAVAKIRFTGMHYRTDIAEKALAKLSASVDHGSNE